MKSKITIIIIIALFTLIPIFAFAQGSIDFKNPIKVGSIQELVTFILDAVVKIGAVIAVFMFVITGFMFVSAQGDPTKLKTAKMSLVGTSIGTVILLGAQILSEVIKNTIDKIQ